MNTKKNLLEYDTTGEEDEFSYDDFLEDVGCLYLKKFRHEYVHIKAENIGWRSLSGEKYAKINIDINDMLETGKEFLRSFIPRTSDYYIQVQNFKQGLYINVKHHDNPVNGDRYYITKSCERTYERHCS